MSDLSADQAIDAAMDVGSPAPDPSPSPTPAPEPVAVVNDPKPPEQPSPSDDMSDVPKAPAPKPAATPPGAPQKPADAPKAPEPELKNIVQLRKAYEARGQELNTTKAELAKWQKDFNDAKKAGYTEAEAKFKADLEATGKRAQEFENQLKYTAFERSDEFKTQYQKPITEAWSRTMDDLKGVKILDSDGSETEQEATSQHVVQLCQLPGIQAAKQAKAWFGDAATEVLAHRRSILDLNQKKDNAIKEWNTKGSELTAAKEKEAESRESEKIKHFDSNLERFSGVIPGFKAPENDPEALGYYKSGVATVALALNGTGMPAGLTESQQMQKRVEAQAKMAAKSIAYGPIAHENFRLKAQIEALNAELGGYKKSTPKPSADVHQPAASANPTADDIIDTIKELRG